MIVEAKPLHKKKKRLAKQRSAQKDNSETSIESNFIKEFIVYNRYKELKKRAMERKENEWQEELNTLMANSQVNNLKAIEEVSNETAAATTPTMTTPASNSTNTNATTSTNRASTSATTKDESIDYIDRTPSPKQTS